MGDICPKCNRELKANAKFCGSCGTSLLKEKPKVTVKWDDKKKPEGKPLFTKYICEDCGQPIRYMKQYSKW